jgi:hypothetical protein
MAHFAKISEDNKVLTVLTLNNSNMLDENKNESELVGQKYLEKHNNWPSHLWIQTSYNTYKNQHKNEGTPFRGNYAGIGYEWDKDNNMFFSKKPYASWVKHLDSASWKSPIGDAPELTVEQKDAMSYYSWNETNQTWNLTIIDI